MKKGGRVGKENNKGWGNNFIESELRIELGKDEEARVNLTRNAPDEKSRGTTIKKPTA